MIKEREVLWTPAQAARVIARWSGWKNLTRQHVEYWIGAGEVVRLRGPGIGAGELWILIDYAKRRQAGEKSQAIKLSMARAGAQ